jgi:Mg2+-importing ATPase
MQFTNPLVLILIFAVAVSLVLQDSIGVLIILAIVVASGLLGLW